MNNLKSNTQSLQENKQAYQQKVDQIQSDDRYTDGAKREMIQEVKAEHKPTFEKLREERKGLIRKEAKAKVDQAYSISGNLSEASTADKLAYDQSITSYSRLTDEELEEASKTVSTREGAKALGRVLHQKGLKGAEIRIAKRFPIVGESIQELHDFSKKYGKNASSKQKLANNMQVNKYRIK